MVFVLLRAFANGGSSLTGIEAVSNAVSAFKPPEGMNARRVLVTEGLHPGFPGGRGLLAGPRDPLRAVHGRGSDGAGPGGPRGLRRPRDGRGAVVVVQAATALILYHRGNTSFNGFPFLASFVEDAFLPRWLTSAGTASSSPTALSCSPSCPVPCSPGRRQRQRPGPVLRDRRVHRRSPWPGSAWPSTTTRTRELHWRRKLVINFSAGVTALIVVAIFVLVKFTEGAWLVVIVFPIRVPALIRLNREYGMEAQVLERISDRPKPPAAPNYTRRTVFVFVDSFDLATIAALRYAQPAPHDPARGSLRHRHRPGGRPARGVDPGRHGRRPGLHRLPRPEDHPGRGRTGQRGGPAAGRAGDGGPAPAELLAADGPAAA